MPYIAYGQIHKEKLMQMINIQFRRMVPSGEAGREWNQEGVHRKFQ